MGRLVTIRTNQPHFVVSIDHYSDTFLIYQWGATGEEAEGRECGACGRLSLCAGQGTEGHA